MHSISERMQIIIRDGALRPFKKSARQSGLGIITEHRDVRRPSRVAAGGAGHSELEIQVVMSDAMMESPRYVTRHGPAAEIVA